MFALQGHGISEVIKCNIIGGCSRLANLIYSRLIIGGVA